MLEFQYIKFLDLAKEALARAEFIEARELMEEALNIERQRSNETLGKGHSVIGYSYLMEWDYKNALTEFETAHQLDPKNVEYSAKIKELKDKILDKEKS